MTRKYLGTVLCATLLLFAACQKAPELTITSASSIELSADGSSGSITFSANRSWSASASDSWVTVSPSSGEASDKPVTVMVRCNANTTFDDRTATVTIRMEELTQIVTVRQPANLGLLVSTQAFVLTSEARTIDVEVQANVTYTVETSVDWIKQPGTKGLTSTKYSFSVAENTTYDDREGTITIKSQSISVPDQIISVKQAQKDAILVKDTNFDMPYGGGEIEIKVESNVAFDVKPAADWIHFVGTKGLSSSTLKLTVDENTTYDARQGQVEITQQGGSIKHTVTVNQAGRIAVASIELDQTSLSIKPGETAILTATVKPDNATDKTVTWTSLGPEIATVDETGKVTAVKNGSATITAKAGEKSAECKVTVCIPVTSIELDNTELGLKVGKTTTLIATVKPDNATDKTIVWSSSDSEIATVDETGMVTAIKDGTAIITVKAGEKTASCEVIVFSSIYVGNAVDLDIIITREDGSAYKLLWADCNLGTDKPEGYGDYYAWGETEEKDNYSWETYKFRASGDSYDNVQFSKYNTKESYGPVDNITVLDPEDDVAHVKLGGKWRMHTDVEWKELLNNCTWTWTTQNEVYGCLLTSKKNGNTIFFPAAGCGDGTNLYSTDAPGYYWSASLHTYNPYLAWDISFFPILADTGNMNRCFGLSVRPVMETELPVTSIELDQVTLTLKPEETATLVATVKPDNATDKTVTWTSSDSSIASVDNTGKVTAIKEGTATITAKAGDKSAICSVQVYKVPDGAVDLGIVMTRADGSTYRLFWAKCNIGASKPEGYGNYYAWGETETKSNYSWSTYKWANGNYNKLTKYCPTDKTDYWDGTGSPDGKTVLDPEDDVAHVKLGGKWRMPTDAEWTELRNSDNCTWTWTTQNGVNGRLVTSKKNGNSIFLPAAGYRFGTNLGYAGSYGFYWSSSLNADYPDYAWNVNFYSVNVFRNYFNRYYGQSVRAVSE